MKTFCLFSVLFLPPLWACADTNENAPSTVSGQAVSQNDTNPAPTSVPITIKRSEHNPSSARALVVHKPMPNPAWGKVVQYHREEIFALSEKNREILHEFVFQDDQGIIRTAIYHENASGDGYWEVTVWDQP